MPARSSGWGGNVVAMREGRLLPRRHHDLPVLWQTLLSRWRSWQPGRPASQVLSGSRHRSRVRMPIRRDKHLRLLPAMRAVRRWAQSNSRRGPTETGTRRGIPVPAPLRFVRRLAFPDTRVRSTLRRCSREGACGQSLLSSPWPDPNCNLRRLLLLLRCC